MRFYKVIFLTSRLLIIVSSFDIHLQLTQILHHGDQYRNFFKQAFVDTELKLATEIESDKAYHHTLKSLPWNLSISTSTHLRQVRFQSSPHHRDKRLPDVKDKQTVLRLAKMSYDAYIRPDMTKEWMYLGGEPQLDEGFGWEDNGVRALVFTDTNKEYVIISFKGTTVSLLPNGHETDTNDKLNDNLLFSCCCASVVRTWKNVCSCMIRDFTCKNDCVEKSLLENRSNNYYYAAQNIFLKVEEQYPNAQIWVTGHSLGGTLSSLIGLAFNVPAVTFESPGDLLPAQRLHLPDLDPRYAAQVPIWHFGHNADPIFIGECKGVESACYLRGYAIESKCHTGKVCTYDTRAKNNWSVSINHHSLKPIIDEVITNSDEVPECVVESDCQDCSLWTYQ